MAKRKEKTIVEDAPDNLETGDLDGKPEKEKKRSGYFIPLTDDGELDIARLRGDTARVDAVRAALNAQGDAGAAIPAFKVNPELPGYLYDGLSKLIQTVGTNFLHWPADFAALMKYSDASKAKLGPPTAAIIERYSPMWLAKNQDLAMLGVSLATETQTMIQQAGIAYARLRPELSVKPVKPNGNAVPHTEKIA